MTRINHVDWLETFVAVAEHGTFVGAAAALHRSQSRVSAHVAAIERALGGPLLDRRHRPVRLTDLGEEFLPYARSALLALDQGQDVADQHANRFRGRLVIGCHPSVSAGFLPAVAATVHAQHPEVRIELTEHATADLVSGILAGRFQLAIHSAIPVPETEDVVRIPLWDEAYVAVVARSHDLARRGGPVAPRDLQGESLIAIARPGEAVDPDTAAAFEAWGLQTNLSWQTAMPQTVVSLARAGLGVGLLNSLAAQTCDSDGVALLPLAHRRHVRRTVVSFDGNGYLSPSAQMVLRVILAAHPPPGTMPPGAAG
ncbi:LysR family transcriptional regulator [Ornithinimicrobium sp. W1679]|uniref:LysR family transcriptional regulator n=1 Tax=Ornithinimicrobium sp. W1679 TaxID=3418770 RepID=UPI003CE85E02